MHIYFGDFLCPGSLPVNTHIKIIIWSCRIWLWRAEGVHFQN